MATNIRSFTATSVFALLAAPALAQDVTGTWHATVEGDMGPVELTFVFRQEGEQVTGRISVGTTEASIADGRVSGTELTFRLPWGGEPGGAPQVLISYRAAVSDDELEVVSWFTGGPDGEPVVTEFTATRAR
jgi:hypothetical protein